MTEPVPPTFSHRFDHPDRRKIVAVALACVAVLAAAAVTVGASPAPSATAGASTAPAASTAPDATTAPDASTLPEHGGWRLDKGADDPRGFGGFGGIGLGRFRGFEITAISGDDVSLTTVDGWTRTITVDSDTTITKGDETIGVDDLAVGDSIRFRQVRNDDGTFTVVRIDVVQPHVAGTVTGVSGSTITIELPGGTTTTVHVDDTTTFKVEGVDGTATVDDVEVGMRMIASGEQNDDGSLDASRVLAGNGRLHDARPWKRGPGAPGGPDTSPAPDASGNPG